MSYGVRGMEKKLLFSNRYEKDMDLFDDLPDDMPELSDIDDAKVPTLDDFYEYMNKKRRCVPNKERIANKDQFIKTVSELSENYKINADLSEFDAGYIADIYLLLLQFHIIRQQLFLVLCQRCRLLLQQITCFRKFRHFLPDCFTLLPYLLCFLHCFSMLNLNI